MKLSNVTACGTPLPIPPPQGGRGKNDGGRLSSFPRPLDGGGLGWRWATSMEGRQ